MGIIISFLVGVLLTGVPFSYFALSSNNNDSEVLAEKIESPSPSPTLTASPSPLPSPTATAGQASPKPSVTPKPTQTPIPQPTFTPAEINAFIERFASQYGVDPNVLRHIAVCESGFNPLASNLGYAGLYQFGPTTWKNYRLAIGEDPNAELRFNAEEAVQTAAYAISQGKFHLWPNCSP